MREAAALLGLSGTQMWRLVREGRLQARTNPVDRREKLVRVADVERLLHGDETRGRFASDGAADVPDAPPSMRLEAYLSERWRPH